jgi:hypothetical protein
VQSDTTSEALAPSPGHPLRCRSSKQGQAAGVRGRRPIRGGMVIAALSVAFVLAVAAAFIARTGRWGFNPTDEGFVLASSWRVLHGEVPHADFATPHLAGSAYLHVLDLLVPGPTFLLSRLIATSELLGASVVLAWLVSGANRRLRLWALLGGVAAGLVNLHTFPVMAWHTIDGILFTAGGFALVERGIVRDRAHLTRVGLALIGIAGLTKQSFLPALVVVLIRVWWPSRWRSKAGGARARFVDLAALAAPGLLYVAAVAARGGLVDAYLELTAAKAVSMTVVLDAPRAWLDAGGPEGGAFLAVVGLLTGSAAVGHLAVRVPRSFWPLTTVADAATRVGVVVLMLWGLFREDLELGGNWGMFTLWSLIAVTAWSSLRSRRWDVPLLLLVALGWMVSLSWGYSVPNLVAGSLAVAAFVRLASVPLAGWPVGGLRRPRSSSWRWARKALRACPAAVAVGGLLATFSAVVDARDSAVYRDRERSELMADLGAVDGDLRGIRSTPVTADFLTWTDRCARAFPARRIAVVPDGAAAYPLFQWRSPALPFVWLYVEEMRGQADRLAQARHELAKQGGYTLLFETFELRLLPQFDTVPMATTETPPFTYGQSSVDELFTRLPGQRTTCGPFLVIHEPERG